MSARLVGVFGGSFTPPHNGHVSAARRVCETLALDSLVVMPAAVPPHKDLSPDAPSPENRLAMTKLAFAGIPRCVVSDLEICLRKPVYTADTLRRMRSDETQLILIVGADMFLTLHEWIRAADILTHTRVAVLIRAVGQEEAVRQQADFLAAHYGAVIDRIEHTPLEISSTELRALLRDGRGRTYIPEPVFGYIRENRLYGVRF
jgi:nicotinate-nucleotide adenylyltransferase